MAAYDWPASACRLGRGFDALCLLLALVLLAALVALTLWLWQGRQRPLLLAPAIGELSGCLEMAAPQAPLEAACTGERGSAAARIESTLGALGPRRSVDGRFELGLAQRLLDQLNLLQDTHDQRSPVATADGQQLDSWTQ